MTVYVTLNKDGLGNNLAKVSDNSADANRASFGGEIHTFVDVDALRQMIGHLVPEWKEPVADALHRFEIGEASPHF